VYHYRRAFTKWDTNYEAQFWFARYAFESPEERDCSDSKEVFARLREVPLSQKSRTQIRDLLVGQAGPVVFAGRVIRLEFDYGFVERDGVGDRICCHRSGATAWEELQLNDRVRFEIGFSFAGAAATNLRKA
jgi:hypothetical protein